jgi:hypothetical protein
MDLVEQVDRLCGQRQCGRIEDRESTIASISFTGWLGQSYVLLSLMISGGRNRENALTFRSYDDACGVHHCGVEIFVVDGARSARFRPCAPHNDHKFLLGFRAPESNGSPIILRHSG